MHECHVCGYRVAGYKKIIAHALEKHSDRISEYERKMYEEDLERKLTCEDCVHCGVIVAPLEEWKPLKKYCPLDYFCDHPSAGEECPNFMPRE